jgi:small-conductance mechanosensitive channel
MISSKTKYRVNNVIITFIILITAFILLLMPIFNPALAVYVSVLAIVTSLALQKYLASFVGYLIIRSASIFETGDRIRIGNVKGDVKHLGLFHIILDEVGEDEKMGGEHTGRIVQVPNLVVLDQPVLNFSKDYDINEKLIKCEYIFDEIRIPLKPNSDIKKAAGILEELIKTENQAFMNEAIKIFEKGLPNFVEDIECGPKITIHIDEERIWIKGKVVTPVRHRNELRSKISLEFIDRIKCDSSIQIN